MIDLLYSAKNPARRTRRYIRAFFGRELWLDRQVRLPSVRLGSDYGGWTVLPNLIGPKSIVYSFGIGDDISWDLGMIDRFGVMVHGFDPTPRCVTWIRRQKLPEAFCFHELGIANYDGDATFVMRNQDPNWNAYNIASPSEDAYEKVTCPVQRLATIMQSLSHDHIDVLKLDIEGAEYDVLHDILAGALRPKQFLIEFHYFQDLEGRLEDTKAAINTLNKEGYKIFSRSAIGHEFSFVR
jgi:FkbM family methyltransferase